MAVQPVRDRPGGVYWSPDTEPALPWRWARQRLERARGYWVSTTRPDGRPHARAVWGVWLDDAFWFESHSIARNLDADPRICVHLEGADEVVILEGSAERITDDADKQRFIDALNPKYQWSWKVENAGNVFRLRPAVAFGWISDNSGSDAGSLFGVTGTRWRFEPDPG